jgi:hypothetical protein
MAAWVGVADAIDEGKGRVRNRATLFFGVYNGFTTGRWTGLHQVYRKKNGEINPLKSKK